VIKHRQINRESIDEIIRDLWISLLCSVAYTEHSVTCILTHFYVELGGGADFYNSSLEELLFFHFYYIYLQTSNEHAVRITRH